MEKKPNNPKAFPCGNDSHVLQGGMTLRDYFASSAMQGVIASTKGIGLEINEKDFEKIAKKAYMCADIMLEQREK